MFPEVFLETWFRKVKAVMREIGLKARGADEELALRYISYNLEEPSFEVWFQASREVC